LLAVLFSYIRCTGL